MARKPKTDRVWFENFDLEVEITEMITRIETFTKFELPAKKRDLVFSISLLEKSNARLGAFDFSSREIEFKK